MESVPTSILQSIPNIQESIGDSAKRVKNGNNFCVSAEAVVLCLIFIILRELVTKEEHVSVIGISVILIHGRG